MIEEQEVDESGSAACGRRPPNQAGAKPAANVEGGGRHVTTTPSGEREAKRGEEKRNGGTKRA